MILSPYRSRSRWIPTGKPVVLKKRAPVGSPPVKNLSSEHGEREGEAPAAWPPEGATRAPGIAMKFISKFEAPWSTPKEPLDVKTGEWRSQRPVTRSEKCRQCGWCFIFCPSGCRKETGHYFSADLDYCKGCGVCSRVCPAKAIILVREEI